jgi:hypothetical protein
MSDINQERYIKSLETYVKQLEEEIQDYQVLLGVVYMPVEDYASVDDGYQGA